MSRRAVFSVFAIIPMVIAAIAVLSAYGDESGILRGPHPTRSGPIVSVKIEPFPEGPVPPPFLLGAGPNQLPIRWILGFIPRPLPEPLDQGADCEFGGNLTIAFEGGARVVYGPCRRPDSIDRLWTEMVRIISEGACEPTCGPGRPT